MISAKELLEFKQEYESQDDVVTKELQRLEVELKYKVLNTNHKCHLYHPDELYVSKDDLDTIKFTLENEFKYTVKHMVSTALIIYF